MKIAAIVQARINSKRFYNKVLVELKNKPLIWHVFNRLKFSKYINKFILATSVSSHDDILEDWAIENNILLFRGNENDVLSRFYLAAKKFNVDIIIRVTADDPFKDPEIIDKGIMHLIENNLNFVSNNNPPTYPEGLDVEIFDIRSLQTAFNNSKDPFEREHVSQYFYNNPKKFKSLNFSNNTNTSNYRWTIDTKIDFKMVKKVYNYLYNEKKIFLYEDLINYFNEFPEDILINQKQKRSDMYNK